MNDQPDPNQMTAATDGTVTRADVPAQGLPWWRRIAALALAVLADAPPLCLLGESFPVIFDVGVAALLWLVLGRNWLLASALVIECIPAIGLAPTWTAYVLFQVVFAKTARPDAADRLAGSSRADHL